MSAVFNLQKAINWANKNETEFKTCCTDGVIRIVKAAGLSMTTGGWYDDLWQHGGTPSGKTPPERSGYKVYATGANINSIVDASGNNYVPSPGDIATYYGGNNPQGKWFKKPIDYNKNKKYPAGYLYHGTIFLGDNVGWVADGHHKHLDRPYKGIDCYYAVTVAGKPSTHVTIYRYENIDGNVTSFDSVSNIDANATGTSYTGASSGGSAATINGSASSSSSGYTNGNGVFTGSAWGTPIEGDAKNLYKMDSNKHSNSPGVTLGTHLIQQ